MSFMRQCGGVLARRSCTLIYRLAKVTATSSRSSYAQILVCARTVQTKANIKLCQLMLGGSAILIVTLFDWRKYECGGTLAVPKLDADEGSDANQEIAPVKFHKKRFHVPGHHKPENDPNASTSVHKKHRKRNKLGFRARHIIEYENRIRHYSTPDKVFRYFATVRLATPNGPEIFMTPDDFLRSICPGIPQPVGLGLDKYRRTDGGDWNKRLGKSSIFYELGSDGLITFSDFIFLLTIMSTTHRYFEIAFQINDQSGKGYVNIDEFQKVVTQARVTSSMGGRHRVVRKKRKTTFKNISSGLMKSFFKDNKLTIKEFLIFQRRLTDEILSLEFDRLRRSEIGNISEEDFADLILAYAGYSPDVTRAKMKRVRKKYRSHGRGISREDYKDFFIFLTGINDVAMALNFFQMAGATIDTATLKHVAAVVVGKKLSDHLCEVVFTIFDDNDDGQLSNQEFVAAMKKRMNRGLDAPKDMGFVKVLLSLIKCTKERCFDSRFMHGRFFHA